MVLLKVYSLDNSWEPSYYSLPINPFNYALWKTLNYTVHVHNQHSLQELKRQYLNGNCQHFKTKALLCVKKYFQNLPGLLRSWRSADVGFVSSMASVIAALSTDMTSWMVCTWWSHPTHNATGGNGRESHTMEWPWKTTFFYTERNDESMKPDSEYSIWHKTQGQLSM